ncbi:MAG: TIM barrel protein [Planctomycetota bacterium]|jgi:sugar phosphate isomerase/epimerase|nr:TIM barrel protein [Planctomycetota bacterium]
MSSAILPNAIPPVLLSGFSDEAANQKTAEQQFCAFAALGLRYYTLRFIDAGAGIQNAMLLAPESIDQILALQSEYGLQVSSLGSPIGKVKLLDVEDGTSNRYVPFDEYLKKDVQRACDLANTFGTKLIRGFSFYHPRGTEPEPHIAQAVDQLGAIARLCDSHGLTFGLEVEANLIGQTGKLLKKLYDGVADPAMLLIFDGANLVCQGMSTEQVYEEYLAMKEGMGWLHVKDYQRPLTRSAHVDEESLKSFVPADQGDSGHEAIFRDIKRDYSELLAKLAKRGIPGLFMDLEPHVKGGGQFGGFSGPDGFGVAMRGLCRVLDYVGLPYDLRTFADIRNSVTGTNAAKVGV